MGVHYMKELKKIETSLEALYKDFNLQLEAIGSDKNEFHIALIKMAKKYPDHDELIQFITFINDKLETNQQIFSGVVVESFNELLKTKRILVQKLIDEKEKQEEKEIEGGFLKRTFKTATNIKDIKVIMMYLTILIALGGAAFAPDASLEILKAMSKLAF